MLLRVRRNIISSELQITLLDGTCLKLLIDRLVIRDNSRLVVRLDPAATLLFMALQWNVRSLGGGRRCHLPDRSISMQLSGDQICVGFIDTGLVMLLPIDFLEKLRSRLIDVVGAEEYDLTLKKWGGFDAGGTLIPAGRWLGRRQFVEAG